VFAQTGKRKAPPEQQLESEKDRESIVAYYFQKYIHTFLVLAL
jgi:hypothetical protein